MELTKEYFDQGLSNLLEKVTTLESNMATKEDLAALRLEMATKTDLKLQTVELKQYVQESFETQQVWMGERFSELIVKYDVRERVGKLEKDVAQLKLSRTAHV